MSMYFYSTRNLSYQVSIDNALVMGIAPDGGLFLPSDFPPVYPLLNNEPCTLQRAAAVVLAPYLSSYFSHQDISDIVQQSFQFEVPLVKLNEGLHVAELFHGPTLAFKDFGGQFMANVLSRILAKQSKRATILVATSGDTGGAVAQGFYEKENVNVVILYPKGKVSELQELQLTTYGKNIRAISIDGTFDDCQRLVKQAFADKELSEKLSLSSANSINIGRLLPQMIYSAYTSHIYFLKYKKVPDVIVPSGNFGNITAALFVKKMGFPIGKLIAATNSNNVVPAYFETGNYIPTSSKHTLSNAMDVGAPSNMERLLTLYNHDLQNMRTDFEAVAVTDEETKKTMRDTYDRFGYIADPHTAVGICVAEKLKTDTPKIVMSTAHPAKFKKDVEQILQIKLPLPTQLSCLLNKQVYKEELPDDYNAFKAAIG